MNIKKMVVLGMKSGKISWYSVGGGDVSAAYSAISQNALVDTYVNLKSPGTHDLGVGSALTGWDKYFGWYIANGPYLITDITPDANYSMMIGFSGVVGAGNLAGCYNNPDFFYVNPIATSKRYYGNGNRQSTSPGVEFGTLCVAGRYGYYNGVLDTPAIGDYSAGMNKSIWIGLLNGLTSQKMTGYINHVIIGPGTWTGPQVLAKHNAIQERIQSAMDGRLLVFGDSITVGTGSTDPVTHGYAYQVAAAKGWGIYNAAVSGGKLQNSIQNSVSTIGAAADDNGRDTYVAKCLGKQAGRVIIMYGTNDLRLNDPGYSAANYGTDLGEVIDGMVTSGISASKIIVCSPPYQVPSHYGDNPPYDGGTILIHESYVAQCAAVAAAKGCIYVDTYAATKNQDAWFGADGIHPNNTGHDALSAAILAVI